MKRYEVVADALLHFGAMEIVIPNEIKAYWTIKEQEDAINQTKKKIRRVNRRINALKMLLDNKYSIIYTNSIQSGDICIDKVVSGSPGVIRMSERVKSMVETLPDNGVESTFVIDEPMYYMKGVLEILKLEYEIEKKHLAYLNAEV